MESAAVDFIFGAKHRSKENNSYFMKC